MVSPEVPLGEPRWPPLTALAVLIVLNIGLRLWLRDEPRVAFPWLVPVIEIVLLGVLALADPTRHAGHRTRGSIRRVASGAGRPTRHGRAAGDRAPATAFSPTDVMPLTHRAKFTMVVQSTVAIALFGLVVARAVKAFT